LGLTVIVPEQVSQGPTEVNSGRVEVSDGRIGAYKQNVYSYDFHFYDYNSFADYDNATLEDRSSRHVGTMNNMTFTTGTETKNPRHGIERGTNVVQGSIDKDYQIRSGGKYKIGIGESSRKDYMIVPGKRRVGNVRIHTVTATSIGCITTYGDDYNMLDGKKHLNEKDFVKDFRNLEKQGNGKTYIRVPKDPEYEHVEHMYNKGRIKPEFAGTNTHEPFGLQNSIPSFTQEGTSIKETVNTGYQPENIGMEETTNNYYSTMTMNDILNSGDETYKLTPYSFGYEVLKTHNELSLNGDFTEVNTNNEPEVAYILDGKPVYK
jgi:hypothetical protein